MVQKKENEKPLEEQISYNNLVLKNQELEIKVNELKNEILNLNEQMIILNGNMHRIDELLTIAANNTLEDGEQVTATASAPVKER